MLQRCHALVYLFSRYTAVTELRGIVGLGEIVAERSLAQGSIDYMQTDRRFASIDSSDISLHTVPKDTLNLR